MKSLLPWLTAALVLLADRLSKMAIRDGIENGSWIDVVPGLTLTHVRNRGIAFSLFADGGPWSRVLLHLVILTAVVVIAWMVVRHGRHRALSGLAFGLILGGALGNLVDRVLWGWVLDFVRVWVRFGGRTWAWPDFNVADSSITVGAILLILIEFGRPREADDAPDSV